MKKETPHSDHCTRSSPKPGFWGKPHAIYDVRCPACRELIWQRAKREIKKHPGRPIGSDGIAR